MLYYGIKLWAEAPERCLPHYGMVTSMQDMLLVLFQKVRFELCMPNDMVSILADPWLVEVSCCSLLNSWVIMERKCKGDDSSKYS